MGHVLKHGIAIVDRVQVAKMTQFVKYFIINVKNLSNLRCIAKAKSNVCKLVLVSKIRYNGAIKIVIAWFKYFLFKLSYRLT